MYINEKKLMIGSSIDQSNKIMVEMIIGIGKKRKFKFSGFDSLDSAKTLHVQLLGSSHQRP